MRVRLDVFEVAAHIHAYEQRTGYGISTPRLARQLHTGLARTRYACRWLQRNGYVEIRGSTKTCKLYIVSVGKA